MDIFKNSKDIAELVQLAKSLIDAHNALYDAHKSLHKHVEELTISHNAMAKHVTHLNKELGIETHIHDGARDPS